jgi:molybdenum cofactor synthesis domain-containing protein
MYKVAVLTVSDRCSQKERADESGKVIHQYIIEKNSAKVVKYDIVPDEPALIKERLLAYCDKEKVDIVFTTGGTGIAPRDFTPEATKEVIEKEIPGIPEAMRILSFSFTRRAVLSRGIAGVRGSTMIINLPGSPQAVRQVLDNIFEPVMHGIEMMKGRDH